MNIRHSWTVTHTWFSILIILTLLTAGPLWAEEIRLTTYYPSPFGEYDQLESNNLVVYGDVLLATVAGTVGIGTVSPSTLLTINTTGTGQVDLIRLSSSGSAYGAIGINTAGRMYFSNTTGGTEHMVLTGSGNIGIGTMSPGAKLEIEGPSTTRLLIDGNTGGSAPAMASAIDLRSNIDYRGRGIFMITADGSTEWYAGVPYTGGGYSIGYDNSGGQGEYDANSKLFVKTNGNVGIGTVNPDWHNDSDKGGAVQLHVRGGGPSYSSGDIEVARFEGGVDADNTRAVVRINHNNDRGLYIKAGRAIGNNGIATLGISGCCGSDTDVITLLESSNVGIGLTNPDYRLTVNHGTNGNSAKFGYLTTGRSGSEYPSVGDNVTYTSTSGQYVYDRGDTAAMIKFTSGRVETYTAAVGSAGNPISFTTGPYVVRGGTSWTSSSDMSLKENIHTLSVLDKLDGYRAVSFDWKASGKEAVGVIAQELYEVFPEVVDTGDDTNGLWGTEYSKLGALALQGVKELNTQTEGFEALTVEALRELKEENGTLRETLEGLEAQIKELKQQLVSRTS